MKNIIKLAFSALLAISFGSCSDFLDRPVLGQESLDTYFQTEEECLKQVTGCYQGVFWDDWWQVSAFYVAADMCSDDMWMGNTTQSQSDWIRMAHYGNPKQDGKIKDFWQYRYKGILRCNIVIQRLPFSPITNESLRKRMMAEAKFLRAFQYFELVKNYGGVPIMEELKMPHEVLGIQRNSAQDVYALIEQDLKDAMGDLPLRSEYSSTNMGRATKGAAMAYLGKAYLYQGKYAEAEDMFSKVVGSGEYALQPKFKDVWTIASNNSRESLFEVQYNSDIAYNLGGRLSVVTGSRDDSGWSWGGPTSNLEKAFKDAGDTERLKWTIIKNGDDVPGDASDLAKNYKITPDKHKSGRVTRKFYIPQAERPSPFDANHIPLNHRLLRYADVLLMYAEAANENNHDDIARTQINDVRKRAGLDILDDTYTGKKLRNAIRLERRLELALEHHRLYDLRRWTDDNGKKALANIMGPTGSFVLYNTVQSTDEYEKTNQKENSNKGITFQENRDLLFPIPHSEVTLSGGSIVQNPNF